ncbi:hypothetical protein GH714_032150 [Hevea brasiliensis]|uniref:Uncharacterized protein n=2 Tax=Hevea brasiliensis TaxID=3981 RepID=A0A6A6MJJ3_HEVBR|nr:hypothetical protein GH714_032150 [Hevea brasiliensis]
MRPPAAAAINSTASAARAYGSGLEHWKSPIPYLFGGFAVMFGLVAMALIILVCYYETSPSNSPPDDVDEAQKKSHLSMRPLEMEPKIVVIMAGDYNPTYLANPVPCTCQSHQQLVKLATYDKPL